MIDCGDFGKISNWPKVTIDDSFLTRLSKSLLTGGKEWLFARLHPAYEGILVWNHLCFLLAIVLENLEILYQKPDETKEEFTILIHNLLEFLVKSKICTLNKILVFTKYSLRVQFKIDEGFSPFMLRSSQFG